MKTLATILVSFVLAACRGPNANSAFSPESPASPNATPASRQPVASVLGAQNPLEMQGSAGKTISPPAASTSESQHHHHHHH